jgi:GMP synthase (glutamine-hydrolysing)
MGDMKRKYFGVQFHPEVHHTPNGIELLKHFVMDICGVEPDWTPASIIEESVKRIREQVGDATRPRGGFRRRGFIRGGGVGA